MKLIAVYKTSDKLVRQISRIADGLEADLCEAGEDWIEIDPNTQQVADCVMYVVSGVLYTSDPRPSASHVWNTDDDQWVLDLSIAKQLKWDQVKAQRDAAEFGSFVWDGNEFDGSATSQARLSVCAVRAQVALDASETWGVDWTLADNTDITLTATELLEVVAALSDGIDAAHAVARAKRVLIDAATSIEDLEAI